MSSKWWQRVHQWLGSFSIPWLLHQVMNSGYNDPSKSNRKRFPCLHSLIWTREGLGEFETVMQTVENSPNPSSVYIRLCKHRKKISIAFIKYFSKLIRQWREILIQKDFPNARSRQSSFLLSNQNAHLISHEPMKFRVTKIKSKFKFVETAINRTPCKWRRYQL